MVEFKNYRKDTVDVVIPNYNSRETLLEAINSTLKQSIPIAKIFVLDDGSDIETQDFLRKNVIGMPKVEVHFYEHSGLPGKLREIGLSKSSADWITFLDSDDWWEPLKIERQLEISRATNAEFICTNAFKRENSSPFRSLVSFRNGSVTTRQLIKDNVVINSSVMVKRDILLKCGQFANDHRTLGIEDYCMWLRCSMLGRIYFLDENLVNYRVSQNSLSKRFKEDIRIYAIIDFYRWLRKEGMLDRTIRYLLLKAAKRGI